MNSARLLSTLLLFAVVGCGDRWIAATGVSRLAVDGASIYWVTGATSAPTLWAQGLAGGDPRKLAALPVIPASLVPAGDVVLVSTKDPCSSATNVGSLLTVPKAGGAERSVATLPASPAGCLAHGALDRDNVYLSLFVEGAHQYTTDWAIIAAARADGALTTIDRAGFGPGVFYSFGGVDGPRLFSATTTLTANSSTESTTTTTALYQAR
jgi:hypothetical protein